MGAPQLTWDSGGQTLDLEDLTLYVPRLSEVRSSTVRADSGVRYTATLEVFDRITIGIDNFDDEALRDGLIAFWQSARKGEAFTFAFDQDDTVNTNTTTGTTASDTTINLADDSAVQPSTKYRLFDDDRRTGNEEIVTTRSTYVTDGDPVTIDNGTLYFHAAGAVFRSVDYFPSLEIAEGQNFPIVENPGLTWTFRLEAREYKSA